MDKKFNYNDVLNATGQGKNFLNNKVYSEKYKELAQYWSKLPLYTNNNDIKTFFNLLHTKQIILLISGTGSGKSVLIPKYLLKYYNVMHKQDDSEHKLIAITSPKQLTTYSMAEYSAKTLDVKLGEEVGYSYKDAPSTSKSDSTQLIYVTDGLLTSIINGKDKLLSNYYGIIVDEAHERNIQIDFLLKNLKDIALERPEFKIIIMSATINSEVFKSYFNKNKKIKYGEIFVSGAPNFPIEQIWENNNLENYNKKYLQYALNKSINIIKDYYNKIRIDEDTKSDLDKPIEDIKLRDPEKNNDIIIFVPSQNDTSVGCTILQQKNINSYCVEMHSKVSDESKELATTKNKSSNIKVIFSTNVAESSITFDGLLYVIDTGLEIKHYFDSEFNRTVVKKTFTTQAQVKQRIGRTGRTMPGIAYHLYTKEQYDSFNEFIEPPILVTDLTSYLLILFKRMNIKDTSAFLNDLITSPTQIQIDNAIYKLEFYNLINLSESRVLPCTALGRAVLHFKSLNIISVYGILLSKYLDCQEEIIIIMGIIETVKSSLNKLFIYDNIKTFTEYIHNFSYPNSDHITLLNIYTQLYKQQKYEFLDKSIFIKCHITINNIISDINKLSESDYEYINYYLERQIEIEPFSKKENNILYILYKMYKLNIVENNNTINFLNNINGVIEYANFTKVNDVDTSFYVCHEAINRFNKDIFSICTHIPTHIRI